MPTVIEGEAPEPRLAAGAGHVDRRVVNQTLPEALLWLWQGYAIR